MDKENEDSIHDKKIDEILKKHAQLDDVCREIFLTLWAYKRLRFNELHKYLKKFGTSISKPGLIDHLNHLSKKKLISRRREGFQNVSYGLASDVDSLLNPPIEGTKELVEMSMDEEKMQKILEALRLDGEEYYGSLPEKEIEKKIDEDIRTVMTHNLFELKTFVDYDLQLDRPESDTVFWNFVGKPLFRMEEERIVEACRNSKTYRKKLFEKIDTLISELRPDRELLKEREEKRKKNLGSRSP